MKRRNWRQLSDFPLGWIEERMRKGDLEKKGRGKLRKFRGRCFDVGSWRSGMVSGGDVRWRTCAGVHSSRFGEPIWGISSQLHLQCHHVGSLKLAMEGVFPPQKSANDTNRSFPPLHLPTEPVYQHSTIWVALAYVCQLKSWKWMRSLGD